MSESRILGALQLDAACGGARWPVGRKMPGKSHSRRTRREACSGASSEAPNEKAVSLSLSTYIHVCQASPP